MQVIKLPAADEAASVMIREIERKITDGSFKKMVDGKMETLLNALFGAQWAAGSLKRKDIYIWNPQNVLNRIGVYVRRKLIGEIRIEINETLMRQHDYSGYRLGFVPIQKIENCPFPGEL